MKSGIIMTCMGGILLIIGTGLYIMRAAFLATLGYSGMDIWGGLPLQIFLTTIFVVMIICGVRRIRDDIKGREESVVQSQGKTSSTG